MSKKRKKDIAENRIEEDENSLAKFLAQATKKLYYISETDAEITPFTGQLAAAVTKEEMLRQIEKTSDVNIEERDFSQMFERLTKRQDWFGEEENETAKKFEALKDLLSKNLKELKVFRIGEIELDIYIVGLDKRGRLAGVKTKAVET